jgi:hypothetical protein
VGIEVKVLVGIGGWERVGAEGGSLSATGPNEPVLPQLEIVIANNIIMMRIGFGNEVIFFIFSRMTLNSQLFILYVNFLVLDLVYELLTV